MFSMGLSVLRNAILRFRKLSTQPYVSMHVEKIRMTESSAGISGRLRESITVWVKQRKEECTHCRECGGGVSPFDSRCPNCGQGSPSKVSLAGAVCVVLGIIFLTGTLSLMVVAG